MYLYRPFHVSMDLTITIKNTLQDSVAFLFSCLQLFCLLLFILFSFDIWFFLLKESTLWCILLKQLLFYSGLLNMKI